MSDGRRNPWPLNDDQLAACRRMVDADGHARDLHAQLRASLRDANERAILALTATAEGSCVACAAASSRT